MLCYDIFTFGDSYHFMVQKDHCIELCATGTTFGELIKSIIDHAPPNVEHCLYALCQNWNKGHISNHNRYYMNLNKRLSLLYDITNGNVYYMNFEHSRAKLQLRVKQNKLVHENILNELMETIKSYNPVERGDYDGIEVFCGPSIIQRYQKVVA